ncbi:MAG: glycosyltransferase [Bacteroidetes bacterium]|nr:glycosyltransferase [Bacteroidota bacterium]
MHKSGKYFSIIIPTWNNLGFLKLCIQSVLKNSTFKHQIICHVNDGSDGTYAWVKEQQLDHTYSTENIGICKALNQASKMAKTDYIVYLNDDMYVCPEWDKRLSSVIDGIGSSKFLLSSTMIEPRDTGNKCVVVNNFGQTVQDFKEQDLLDSVSQLNRNDWNGSTWPPIILRKELWDQVGGLSEEFSPGLYSDPDLSMKLWNKGCRIFQGVGSSLVYHFQSKSTEKVKMNNGKKQFLQKWGISSSTFTKHFLRSGQPYAGPLDEPAKTFSYNKDLLKAKLKKSLNL